MTIKVWITNKVHNIRYRFYEHSMSTATTSTTISSDDSLIQRYKVKMNVLGNIRARMAATTDYCTLDTPHDERCGSCKGRKGKFVGEICKHPLPFCKLCCFGMVEKGFHKWEGGVVHVDCPICYKEITLLHRVTRRSIGDGFDDSSSNSEEATMSIAELTESLIKEGMMNEGFESSGSL